MKGILSKLLYYSTLAGSLVGQTRILGIKTMLTKIRHLDKLEIEKMKGGCDVKRKDKIK